MSKTEIKIDNRTKDLDDAASNEIIQTTRKNKYGGNNKTGKGLAGVLENITPGENSRYLRHALGHFNLPPIDIRDDKAVEERILWYFNNCAENDMKPTVTGMANCLGVSRRTLYAWSVGETRDATHSPIVKRAYNLLEELWENYMQNGKINPVSGIFLGKNMFGYKDQSEVVLAPKDPLGDVQDEEELRQKYIDNNVIDID